MRQTGSLSGIFKGGGGVVVGEFCAVGQKLIIAIFLPPHSCIVSVILQLYAFIARNEHAETLLPSAADTFNQGGYLFAGM